MECLLTLLKNEITLHGVRKIEAASKQCLALIAVTNDIEADEGIYN